MDYMPPAFVQKVGNRWLRYVIRDAIGQTWTGSGWSSKPSQAVLYCNEIDAIETRNRIGLGGDVADTFTATIVLSAHKDEWTVAELIAYLQRHRKSALKGPRGKNGILLELLPDVLKKFDSSGESDNGPD